MLQKLVDWWCSGDAFRGDIEVTVHSLLSHHFVLIFWALCEWKDYHQHVSVSALEGN